MFQSFILPVVSKVKGFSTSGSTAFNRRGYSSPMESSKWWKKAQNIRQEKKRAGLPMRYADIAVAIDVKPERLGHWFVGRRPAPVPKVEAIAQYLGVHVADLFLPNDGMCVTDPKLIAALKVLAMMSEDQKSVVLPKPNPRLKRGVKRPPKKRAA